MPNKNKDKNIITNKKQHYSRSGQTIKVVSKSKEIVSKMKQKEQIIAQIQTQTNNNGNTNS